MTRFVRAAISRGRPRRALLPLVLLVSCALVGGACSSGDSVDYSYESLEAYVDAEGLPNNAINASDASRRLKQHCDEDDSGSSFHVQNVYEDMQDLELLRIGNFYWESAYEWSLVIAIACPSRLDDLSLSVSERQELEEAANDYRRA